MIKLAFFVLAIATSRLEWITHTYRHSGRAGNDNRDRGLDREQVTARQLRSLAFCPIFDEMWTSGTHFATALSEIGQFGQRPRFA